MILMIGTNTPTLWPTMVRVSFSRAFHVSLSRVTEVRVEHNFRIVILAVLGQGRANDIFIRVSWNLLRLVPRGGRLKVLKLGSAPRLPKRLPTLSGVSARAALGPRKPDKHPVQLRLLRFARRTRHRQHQGNDSEWQSEANRVVAVRTRRL